MDFVPGPFRYTEIDFVDRPISLPDRATALSSQNPLAGAGL